MRASSCSKNSAVFMTPPGSFRSDCPIYERNGRSASDGNHEERQVARMKKGTVSSIFLGFAATAFYAVHRTIRRSCGGRRPRGMRGGNGLRTYGTEDRPLHA